MLFAKWQSHRCGKKGGKSFGGRKRVRKRGERRTNRYRVLPAGCVSSINDKKQTGGTSERASERASGARLKLNKCKDRMQMPNNYEEEFVESSIVEVLSIFDALHLSMLLKSHVFRSSLRYIF